MARLAPTHPASRETKRHALKTADDQAWEEYERACWNVQITPEQRHTIFQKALQTLEALLAHDRTQ